MELGLSAAEVVDQWDAGFGDLAHSRQTRWNWLSGHAKFSQHTLRLARRLNAPETWQHQMALDLLAAYQMEPVAVMEGER